MKVKRRVAIADRRFMAVGYTRRGFVPEKISSPFDADSLFGNEDLIADAQAVGFLEKAFQRLIVRLIA